MTTNSQPKLRRRELFSACGYKPHERQRLVHASKASRRVLACGVRWGKSTCASMEAVAALFEPRDRTLGWIVAPTYGSARRIFDEVARVIHEHFPHRIRRYDTREHVLTVVNFGGGHSTLRGKSADNPVSLLSEALDFVIVDEAARVKEEVWQQHLSQRLLDRNGWALLISTPQGMNWFRKLYKRGQRGADLAFESWSQPSWTNPHVSRELIEEERKRMSDDVFAQEYEGKFVGEASEPCDECGWPDVFASTVLILDHKDQVLPRCPSCERYVNSAGHTVCGRQINGVAYVTTICSMPRPTNVPPIPGVYDHLDFGEVSEVPVGS